jgi:hypothetical protein
MLCDFADVLSSLDSSSLSYTMAEKEGQLGLSG